MKIEKLEYHPFANLFPMMTPQEQADLEADIQANGLLETIIVHEGMILDGRNRYRACISGNIPIRMEQFTGKDPLAFVVSRNLHRRHLSESQRSAVAAKLANMKVGNPEWSTNSANLRNSISQSQAAAMMNVSQRALQAAKQVQRESPELFDQVERGEKTVHQAQQEIKQQKLACVDPPIAPDKPKPVPLFNETNDSIEWAKWTWNPVTGCKHGCPYCYARDIANRFNGGFEPKFHPERLEAPFNMRGPKQGDCGRMVFVCSMADLFGAWVPQEWIDQVLEAVAKSPQWIYLFLTKNPLRLAHIKWPANAWVGTTVDRQDRVKAAEEAFRHVQASVRFVSLEPLTERITFNHPERFDWYIIGGRSRSNELPEFQPRWEWVEHLLGQIRSVGAKVYFKPNLKTVPKEYPDVDGGRQ